MSMLPVAAPTLLCMSDHASAYCTTLDTLNAATRTPPTFIAVDARAFRLLDVDWLDLPSC